ncbi:hypothetical protein MY3296_000448 [Beauveria thailandica]
MNLVCADVGSPRSIMRGPMSGSSGSSAGVVVMAGRRVVFKAYTLVLSVTTEDRLHYASSSIEFLAYHVYYGLAELGEAVVSRQVQDQKQDLAVYRT